MTATKKFSKIWEVREEKGERGKGREERERGGEGGRGREREEREKGREGKRRGRKRERWEASHLRILSASRGLILA